MWCMLSNNQFIEHWLFEWFKLIELLMAMVLGSVEDERCFPPWVLWTVSWKTSWQHIWILLCGCMCINILPFKPSIWCYNHILECEKDHALGAQ
jgi:hypothetical protein